MRHLHFLTAVALIALAGACSDERTPTTTPPVEEPVPLPVGVYEFTVSGITGGSPSASVAYVPPGGEGTDLGADGALVVAPSPLPMEQISVTATTEGERPRGQRYVAVTYRVRNATGSALENLTFIPVSNPSTKAQTPFLQMRKFDGSQVDTMVMRRSVPSGVVMLGPTQELQSPIPDVLQVFEESEVAAIPLPVGLTGIYPYGFVVRSKDSNTDRILPATSDVNRWDGLLTLSFRIPLQPNDPGQNNGETKDAFGFTIRMLAVEDGETRMTESIEEGQDTAAVRRLRDRATSLGATTVTVLAGSPRLDPTVLQYPGQRDICSVRTAGPPGAPVTRITTQADYVHIAVMRPGEVFDECSPNFRGGTPDRPATGVDFPLTLVAADRYGHRVPITDSVRIAINGAAGGSVGPPVKFTDGDGVIDVTYSGYGASTVTAIGRRNRGTQELQVMGVTRTWTGNSSTNWTHGANWNKGAPPMHLDSAIIPSGRPRYPTLLANTEIARVTMTDGGGVPGFINLGSFDFTLSNSIDQGPAGTIQGTGRMIFAGVAQTIDGGISNVDYRNARFTGTYSLNTNLNVTGGRIVVQGGRLRSTGHRIRVRPN